MKIREVITRAMSGKINWIQAAEILGMSDRQLRRWRNQWSKHGYNGWQRRLGLRPCTGREPRTQAERQPLYIRMNLKYRTCVRYFALLPNNPKITDHQIGHHCPDFPGEPHNSTDSRACLAHRRGWIPDSLTTLGSPRRRAKKRSALCDTEVSGSEDQSMLLTGLLKRLCSLAGFRDIR